MEFKKILEKELAENDMTLYGLGKSAKKPSGWIYAVMGNNSPTLKTVQQLTEALGGKITLTFENREYELCSAVETTE